MTDKEKLKKLRKQLKEVKAERDEWETAYHIYDSYFECLSHEQGERLNEDFVEAGLEHFTL